jgi:hypothetical protein
MAIQFRRSVFNFFLSHHSKPGLMFCHYILRYNVSLQDFQDNDNKNKTDKSKTFSLLSWLNPLLASIFTLDKQEKLPTIETTKRNQIETIEASAFREIQNQHTAAADTYQNTMNHRFLSKTKQLINDEVIARKTITQNMNDHNVRTTRHIQDMMEIENYIMRQERVELKQYIDNHSKATPLIEQEQREFQSILYRASEAKREHNFSVRNWFSELLKALFKEEAQTRQAIVAESTAESTAVIQAELAERNQAKTKEKEWVNQILNSFNTSIRAFSNKKIDISLFTDQLIVKSFVRGEDIANAQIMLLTVTLLDKFTNIQKGDASTVLSHVVNLLKNESDGNKILIVKTLIDRPLYSIDAFTNVCKQFNALPVDRRTTSNLNVITALQSQLESTPMAQSHYKAYPSSYKPSPFQAYVMDSKNSRIWIELNQNILCALNGYSNDFPFEKLATLLPEPKNGSASQNYHLLKAVILLTSLPKSEWPDVIDILCNPNNSSLYDVNFGTDDEPTQDTLPPKPTTPPEEPPFTPPPANTQPYFTLGGAVIGAEERAAAEGAIAAHKLQESYLQKMHTIFTRLKNSFKKERHDASLQKAIELDRAHIAQVFECYHENVRLDRQRRYEEQQAAENTTRHTSYAARSNAR